jgi:hypothetical protein
MRKALMVVLGLASTAWAQNPIGQIFASDATVRGSVELASGGARVMSGSWVSAGETTAVLKLDRGGEVRICPRTSLSVATSQSGRDLLLGLSVGGLETHYTVSATADSIVTPDFRILLAGPGRFDFAIEASKGGDTCIRALPGNSSSLIISELMGDATYQVKPAERLVFHNGRVQSPDHDNANCGCVAVAPVLRAEAVAPEESKPDSTPAPKAEVPKPSTDPPVHVEVDAPFVFHGDSPDPGQSPLEGAITLHVANNPPVLVPLPPPVAMSVNVPPPSPHVDSSLNKPKQNRFFGRVKSFFASIFR